MTRTEVEKIVSEARTKGEIPNLSRAKIDEAQIMTVLKCLNIKVKKEKKVEIRRSTKKSVTGGNRNNKKTKATKRT